MSRYDDLARQDYLICRRKTTPVRKRLRAFRTGFAHRHCTTGCKKALKPRNIRITLIEAHEAWFYLTGRTTSSKIDAQIIPLRNHDEIVVHIAERIFYMLQLGFIQFFSCRRMSLQVLPSSSILLECCFPFLRFRKNLSDETLEVVLLPFFSFSLDPFS